MPVPATTPPADRSSTAWRLLAWRPLWWTGLFSAIGLLNANHIYLNEAANGRICWGN